MGKRYKKPEDLGLKDTLIKIDSFGVTYDLDKCLKVIQNLKFPWHKSHIELDKEVIDLHNKLKKN